MSLVGSEVDISIETDASYLNRKRFVSDDDEENSLSDNCQVNVDFHAPLTPPRPAEKLFLNNLNTQNISAAALAEQIHQSLKAPSSRMGTSIATDDFLTAMGSVQDDFDTFDFPDNLPLVSTRSSHTLISSTEASENKNIFGADVLSRNFTYNPEEEIYLDANMSTQSYSAKAAPASSGKFFPTEAPTHVDAAEKVYDTAKSVWSWGKGVVVISPFLGLAEAVAGKAVSMTGSSLETLDGEVVKQLHGLDDSLLNPAIEKIASILLGVAGKSEDVLKPVLMAMLKPLGLIKETASNPEQTPVVGVTVSQN